MSSLQLYNEIQSLPLSLQKQVESFVAFLKMENEKNPKKETKLKERKFGALKGKVIMSDDFDEPLEDFKDYM